MHTYASFYRGEVPPLEAVARNLVQWGLAECAVTSEGEAFWNRDEMEAVRAGRSDCRARDLGRQSLSLEPTTDRRLSRVDWPRNVKGFPAQSLYEWVALQHHENLLFDDSPLPPPNVWARIAPCTFGVTGRRHYALVVYPELKIFETGVVLVHLRMFSPSRPVFTSEFVGHYLNASLRGFDWLTVPPGLTAWAPLALSEKRDAGPLARAMTARRQFVHQREVASRTSLGDHGDFSHLEVELDPVSQQERLEVVSAGFEKRISVETRAALRRAAEKQGIRLSDDLEPVGSVVLERDPRESISEHGANEPPTLEELVDSFDWTQFERELDIHAEASGKRIAREIAGEILQKDGSRQYTFLELSLTLMSVAGLVAASRRTGPRRGLKLALLGPGACNERGDFWSSRPHSILIRYGSQSASASKNVATHYRDLAAILARIELPKGSSHDGFPLPPTTRPFDDFSAHVAQSGSIWVHGRDSLRSFACGAFDANREGLTREHQARIEVLEYGYTLQRRIAELALVDELSGKPGELLRAQRDLADFDLAVVDTGRFSEIREQLKEGWKRYGIADLRRGVLGALEVREKTARYRQERGQNRWASFLAILFGLLAVPGIRDAVVAPLWSVLELWLPPDDNVQRLYLLLISFLLVATVLLFAGRRLGRRNED